jgi:MFS family permease
MKGIISEGLLSRQFVLLCLSATLFMGSFNMIIPELPNYLTSLGGAEYKGLIISLFAATAALSRPFSGKLTDLIGRKPIMIFGAVAAAVCGALYPFFATIWGFFILRLVHGLSAGFKPTGSTAYLADVIDPKNRGEALGFLGMSGSVGMAAGPAIGSALAMKFGLNAMFAVSSFTALLSILILLGMEESIETKRFELSMLKINFQDIFEKRVIAPALVMILTVYSFGMALTIIPDFSEHLGIKNKGIFFTVMLIASIITRLYSGKASDRLGRVKMLRMGSLALLIGMSIIAFAGSVTTLFAGALIFGIATGINSPTLFAWTVDLADSERRGRAMATLFIALELGILAGALSSAEIYSNNEANFTWAFLSGSILATVSLAYLLVKNRL